MCAKCWGTEETARTRRGRTTGTAGEVQMLSTAAALQGWTVQERDLHVKLIAPNGGVVMLARRPALNPLQFIDAALRSMVRLGYEP